VGASAPKPAFSRKPGKIKPGLAGDTATETSIVLGLI
jgi:hypothetical protein